MSLYVDARFDATYGACPSARRWCHVFTDAQEELHGMAEAIDIRRSWFQSEPGREPRYDLVPAKRARAIALGAVEIASTRAFLTTEEGRRRR